MSRLPHNPHPGEILDEEFLKPASISQKTLADTIGVPSNRINAIVRGLRGISADTDLRLSRYFGLTKGFWLKLQNSFDLMEAERKSGQEIAKIKPHQKHHKSFVAEVGLSSRGLRG
ncbi:MAG TPA: HigA family addiction module antitoxin [Wenzhouxiangella sp.]